MQKKQTLLGSIQNAQETFNSAAPQSETEEIRHVQRTLPDADINESLNIQDLTYSDAASLRAQREGAALKVAEFENAAQLLPPIEGVYLHFDNHGV